MRARRLSWLKPLFMAACCVLFTAEVAHAQPFIRVSGPEPSVFEGDPGGPAVTLNFTVQLSAVSTQQVTVLFSTFTFGNASGALSGTSCTGADNPNGPDFIGITNQLVTIPANLDPPSVPVPVTVCPDNQVEVHNFSTTETLGVLLQSPINAVCSGSDCLNKGHIIDDDGSPFASVDNVTAKEPGFSGTKNMTFTVTLSHPHPGFEVRVNYATRPGTAGAQPGTCGGPSTDYFSKSGTLIFPSNDTSETFQVTICGDAFNEPTETFFVDLTSQLNVTASSVPGTGSILNYALPSFGTFTLDPEGSDAQAEEWLTYRFEWTVSVGVWRDLQALELRFVQRDTGNVPLWIRWVESTNTFQLCDGPGNDSGVADTSAEIRCGPPAVAGSAQVLDAPLARLDMSGTRAIGSGPTGPSVTLELLLSFKRGAANRTYDVEVAAESDAGLRDDFMPGGVLLLGR
jgi:Calx-beta domain